MNFNLRLITDDEEVRLLGNLRDLSEEGISIRMDNAKNSLMHNKFVIIDHKILMTGSYNWTVRATKTNQENVVILDDPYLVNTFITEFNKLWKQFTPDGFGALEGKAKKKTKLYQKYLTALEKKKNEKDIIISFKEEKIEVTTGIQQSSKKISKLKATKRSKNSKRPKAGGVSNNEEEDSTPKTKDKSKVIFYN